MTKSDAIPFRIRVGVTGHRALDDPAAMVPRIREGLASVGACACVPPIPSDVPIAFTIVSALAEGADRLVAQTVLETEGGSLEVVLPLAREDYLEDFDSHESRGEFEELLRRADRTVVLTPPASPERPAEERVSIRTEAYERAGRYVVEHCELLIALWDGRPSRGRGGTSEIVEYALVRRRPVVIVSTFVPYALRIERGDGIDTAAVEGLQAFNGFVVPPQEAEDYARNVGRDLFDTPEGKLLPEARKTAVRETIVPLYVRASLLAKKSQKEYQRAGLWAYTLSVLAVVAVAAGVVVPPLRTLAFGSEALLLAALVAIVLLAHRRGSHRKWLEFRFLAERLRCAAFLVSCGAAVPRAEGRSGVSPGSKGEEWMGRAFEEICRRLPPAVALSGACEAERAFARARWVGEQRAFHAGKAKHAGAMSRRLESAGRAVFILALAAAASHFALPLVVGEAAGAVGVAVGERVLTFLAIVLPGAGAALGGIRAHREYSRLATRSESMEVILRELEARLDATTNAAAFERQLRAIEMSMLRESHDWLTLMRYAVLEPV